MRKKNSATQYQEVPHKTEQAIQLFVLVLEMYVVIHFTVHLS
jgi:hypothetical protein